MKIRFGIFILLIAVIVSVIISGCSDGVVTDENILGNSSNNIAAGVNYGNLSVTRETVSGDKIYDLYNYTTYSRVSSSKYIDSQQITSESQSYSSSEVSSELSSESSSSRYNSNSSSRYINSSSSHNSTNSSSDISSSSDNSPSSEASSNIESSSAIDASSN